MSWSGNILLNRSNEWSICHYFHLPFSIGCVKFDQFVGKPIWIRTVPPKCSLFFRCVRIKWRALLGKIWQAERFSAQAGALKISAPSSWLWKWFLGRFLGALLHMFLHLFLFLCFILLFIRHKSILTLFRKLFGLLALDAFSSGLIFSIRDSKQFWKWG